MLCNPAGWALRYVCQRFRRVPGCAILQTASSSRLGRHKEGGGEGGNQGPGRERAFNYLSAVASDSLICPVMKLGGACVPRTEAEAGVLGPDLWHPSSALPSVNSPARSKSRLTASSQLYPEFDVI